MKRSKSETAELYRDLAELNTFLNTNDNSEKIATMLRHTLSQIELARTPEVKFIWMELSSSLTNLSEKIVDVLEKANKHCNSIGYKIF